ncbi:MAG: hypothetical protein JJT76_06240 [Clostridiaceae bacterium]|nr:hypothetical protein [Clostridiaceae bacterium]
MRKEDITKNVRQKYPTIQDKEIKIKSLEVGWKSVAVAMTFLIIWRIIHNETPTDILMILFAYNGGESFYNYSKMPEKKHFLITGIFCIVGVGLAIATMLSQYGIY